MGRRADALADRVEEGAASLAAFAKSLNQKEWTTVVKRDGRTIGVIVHHVASVYPIEIELAQTIASGKPVAGVTWDVVAGMNANHAKEHASVSQADALDLLRKNSTAAAEALRKFSDAELDQAAPFSLSFDAPVTAQFVLEDHAVRHSWHHLARIREALGR